MVQVNGDDISVIPRERINNAASGFAAFASSLPVAKVPPVSYGLRGQDSRRSQMQGTGACAGSCDDLTVTEEQIAIGKRDHDPQEHSANPSARCSSSRGNRHSANGRRSEKLDE
jgi:hypothetical protein